MDSITSKPMITTIIPTYRRPKLLQRAIRSVLNQTYPHFQVCVYDNASWDETAAVVSDITKGDHVSNIIVIHIILGQFLISFTE